MILKLISNFKEWRKRRHWEKQQLGYLRTRLSEEWRWLAGIPIADAIIERHVGFARDDWYQTSFEDITNFRERLYKMPGGNLVKMGFTIPAPNHAEFAMYSFELWGEHESLKLLKQYLEYLAEAEKQARSPIITTRADALQFSRIMMQSWSMTATGSKGFSIAIERKDVRKHFDMDADRIFPRVQFPLPSTPAPLLGR